MTDQRLTCLSCGAHVDRLTPVSRCPSCGVDGTSVIPVPGECSDEDRDWLRRQAEAAAIR